jgi:hypothetical protein
MTFCVATCWVIWLLSVSSSGCQWNDVFKVHVQQDSRLSFSSFALSQIECFLKSLFIFVFCVFFFITANYQWISDPFVTSLCNRNFPESATSVHVLRVDLSPLRALLTWNNSFDPAFADSSTSNVSADNFSDQQFQVHFSTKAE